MPEKRGSEKWLKQTFQRPVVTLDERYYELFRDIAAIDGVKLIDWTTRGTPKPDVLHGALQVEPDKAGEVFGRLSDLQHWIRHEWFPIGIVDPEGFIVNVTNERELGR